MIIENRLRTLVLWKVKYVGAIGFLSTTKAVAVSALVVGYHLFCAGCCRDDASVEMLMVGGTVHRSEDNHRRINGGRTSTA